MSKQDWQQSKIAAKQRLENRSAWADHIEQLYHADPEKVLRFVANLPKSSLGSDADVIQRGLSANDNPDMYRQMKQDPVDLIAKALARIVKRYDIHLKHQNRCGAVDCQTVVDGRPHFTINDELFCNKCGKKVVKSARQMGATVVRYNSDGTVRKGRS